MTDAKPPHPNPAPAAAAKAVRNRDLALMAGAFVVGFFAVWYRGAGFDLGLVLLSAALFWIAVLDSALHGASRSRLMVVMAATVLAGLAVIVIATAVLVLRRPAVPVEQIAPATVPLPAPTSPPGAPTSPAPAQP